MSGYQTFSLGAVPSVGGEERMSASQRARSIPRLVCFGIVLMMIAVLLLGPLSFVVAMVKMYFFPDSSQSETVPNDIRTYLFTIMPRLVSFPSFGPTCSYYAYLYGGTMPGPAIHVFPGQTFHLHVVNTLGRDPLNSLRKQNELRFPNSTTTHFHGLHVSPEGKADNVYEVVAPSHNFTNVVTLREDHPSGTYFVHPHLHGSTGMQTGFSMASPLIVRDVEEPWRSLPEEVFVVQRGGVGSGHKADDARVAFELNEAFHQPDSSTCTFPKSFVLVNGALGPFKTLCERQFVRRWRVINAATDGGLVLKFEPSIDTCEARVIARDGVYLAEGRPRKVEIGTDIYVVPPGGRIDFLVKGEGCELTSGPNARIRKSLGPNTHLLIARIASCTIARPLNNDDDNTVAQASRLADFPPHLPALPNYMDDLRGYPKAERRVLEWTEFTQAFKAGEAKYGINGEPFSRHSRFTVRLNRVQEWVIVNALAGDKGPAVESHPFHLHTNHFQVVGFAGQHTLNNEDYVVGQWRDTVYVPTPGNLTIRWIPRHFTGKSLLHCHILSHEDLGMSWSFSIVEGLRR